jgi:hypothetical protein
VARHPKRARWHLHFTPTSSSWLNLVERWFYEITQRRLRRGTFSSVEALVEAIELWAGDTGTTTRSPSCGTRPPTRIIEKVRRERAALLQVKAAVPG